MYGLRGSVRCIVARNLSGIFGIVRSAVAHSFFSRLTGCKSSGRVHKVYLRNHEDLCCTIYQCLRRFSNRGKCDRMDDLARDARLLVACLCHHQTVCDGEAGIDRRSRCKITRTRSIELIRAAAAVHWQDRLRRSRLYQNDYHGKDSPNFFRGHSNVPYSVSECRRRNILEFFLEEI